MVVGLAFDTPSVLLTAPIAAAALYHLMYLSSNAEMTSQRRAALYASRLVVVTLIAVALAGPYVVAPTSVDTGDTVQVFVDDSASMEVFEASAEDVVDELEAEGVDVTRTRVASGDDSPLGDALLSNVDRGGDVLLLSDGRVTHGASMSEAARTAASLDARLNAVDIEATEPAGRVEVTGPSVVGDGVTSTFEVSFDGVEVDEASVEIQVDGATQTTVGLAAGESHEFQHSFQGEGSHRITASADVDDVDERNDVYRKSVRVVEPPRLLYVAPANYPYSQLLDDLYHVEFADTVPFDLDPYHAVVLQNVGAEAVGDAAALQEHVLEGNGLVVAGGPNAYDEGYDSSLLGSMLPVRTGGLEYDTDVVILVDVSSSVEEEVEMNRRLAATAVESMSDDHSVGVMAFDHNAYQVGEMRSLEDGRSEVLDTISRIQPSGGATDVYVGLRGAGDMLEDGGGNVVLVSDGDVRSHLEQRAVDQAREMGERGVRVVGVGVGEADHVFMRTVARASGGSYFPGADAGRLSVLFDDEEGAEDLDGITVMDRSHFVTSGVEPTGSVGSTHRVAPRDNADLLAVAGDGRPAVSAWSYGSGRVVAVTGHRGDGVLGSLLQQPDRALVTRSAAWTAGDPLRKQSDVYTVSDTHVGERTTAEYRGSSRPRPSGYSFRQTGEDRYEAVFTPTETGFESVSDAEYAVNYPRELSAFGVSPELRSAVNVTGGEIYEAGEYAALADDITEREPVTRTTRQERDWLFLTLALLLYLTEVSIRRLEEVYGYRLAEALPQPIYRWMK